MNLWGEGHWKKSGNCRVLTAGRIALKFSVAFDYSEKSVTPGLTGLTILHKDQTKVNAGQKSHEHSSGVSLEFLLIL